MRNTYSLKRFSHSLYTYPRISKNELFKIKFKESVVFSETYHLKSFRKMKIFQI